MVRFDRTSKMWVPESRYQSKGQITGVPFIQRRKRECPNIRSKVLKLSQTLDVLLYRSSLNY